MKKTLLTLSILFGAALFGSCGLKSCYCCEAVGTTAVAQETYTDNSSKCSSLTNNTRTCMEMSEQIDCSKVAIGYKK